MKKVLLITLVLLFTLCMTFSLVSCNKDKGEEQKTIVYLGDSIAEAIIGPSSLSERDNYGYYAVVGKINNYKYYNHSVSGHQTSSGMLTAVKNYEHVDGLLEMVSREDEDGALLKTHIKEADVIHISILGNNALQFDLGWLLLEAADPDFETKMANGTSLLYHMMHGIDGLDPEDYTRTSMRTFDTEGIGVDEVYRFPNTIQDISDIVKRLKELNPNAKIIFQKVYNPVYEGTTLVKDAYWEALGKIKDTNGAFGEKDAYITTWEQRRAVAQRILDVLNGVLDDYNTAHPGEISILDINKYFDDITQTQEGEYKLGTNSVGAQLLYTDWTHPSNKGHAAIAAATQTWLESIGMADSNALANYKALRIEQVNRMYANCTGFNASDVVAKINAGNSITEVTNIYFACTDAFAPDYSRANLQYDRSGEKYYDSTVKYEFDAQNVEILLTKGYYTLAESAALNKDACYIEFTKDGKMHAQIQTKDGLVTNIDSLLSMIETAANVDMDDVIADLAEVDLDAAVDSAVTGFFPGFTLDDLIGSIQKIEGSLGVTINGLSNPNAKGLLDYVAANGKLPADLIDQLPEDLVLTLTVDTDYRIKEVKTSDGATKRVIYLGKEVAANDSTQPFAIFEEKTIKKNGKEIKQISLTVEFIGVTLVLNEVK